MNRQELLEKVAKDSGLELTKKDAELFLNTTLDVIKKAVKKGELLSELTLSISARVGEEGKLFGSVGTQDICDAINKHSIEVEKKEILLADGPLRTVGTHEIAIRLHPDVTIGLEVSIVDDNKDA